MDNKKVALITGASSGIGKTMALRLLDKGYIVYAAARRVERMKELEEKDGRVLKMDITKENDIKKVINQIVKDERKIDVLINNAGYAIYGSVEEVELSKAKNQFEVNLFGLANLTKMIIPLMRKEKSGKIINISSMGGKIYTPLGAWYHASKHALEGWSDCLRLELAQFNIDVVIIEPGIIDTEFDEVMVDPLLETSGKGPYKKLAESVAASTKKNYQPNNASSPDVVAKTVIKAIETNNPKTRYSPGKLAKTSILLRKYLGDRLFDKFVTMMA